MQICGCFLLFSSSFYLAVVPKVQSVFFYTCCSLCLRICIFCCTLAAELNYSMTLTRTYYRIAEHLFAVECGNAALLQCMTNYEPFRVENGKLKSEEWTHVLTDNAEDMPRIEVYQASRREGNEVKGERQKARGWMFRVAMVANAPICCEMECSEDFTNGVLYITTDCQDVRFCIDNELYGRLSDMCWSTSCTCL